jgi:crossover junction endodeoxyribonuclease RusA
MIEFTVSGTPAPQGSKRYLGVGSKGKVRMAESSARVAPWRADVRAAAERALPEQHLSTGFDPSCAICALWEGPVIVVLSFRFARPASHYRTGKNSGVLRDSAPEYPIGKKDDLDKLERAVLDALTSVVFADDGQVVSLSSSKLYAWSLGQAPGVTVTVKGA